MMLVVEGTDGVGKTTLCHAFLKKLQEHGPWIYSHFTKLPLTWHYPMSYFPRMSQYIVQDRFHMSEIVYRAARNETSCCLTPLGYSLVDAKLRQLGGMTIIILGTEEIIHRNYKGDNDMHDVTVHLRANALYQDLVSQSKTVYKVDYDFCWNLSDGWPSDNFVTKVVKTYIDRQNVLAVWQKMHGSITK